MSVLQEEIFSTLEDRYLFTGLKKNINEWSEKDILKIFNRLLNVYDPEYNSNDLDYDSKNGRRHITRYLQRMGLGYLVPKVEDLVNRTKALKVITALDDRVSSKYREVAPKRVRAVVKKEQLWKLKEKKPCREQENIQPNLQEEKNGTHLNLPEEGFIFKSKGHQLPRTPIKPPDSISSGKKETLIVPLECEQERKSSNDNLPLVRLDVPAKSNYIPCGRQIPRTPKRIDDVDTNCEFDHDILVDAQNVKTGKKSYVYEDHPAQDKGNNAEKEEKMISTVLPESNLVSCNPDYDSDDLEIFPSKVTSFIPVEVGNAESCDQALENRYIKEENEYCDAVPYPKTEHVTGVETISNGDEVVGISSPFIKDEIGPVDAVQSDESYTEKNSKGSTKSSVVLDERIDRSPLLPNYSSSEEKENTSPSANSSSEVNCLSTTRGTPKIYKKEQRRDSSNLPLQSLSVESDEKTIMTQKEFLMIDEKPLAITGTPDIINDSMSFREYQKNIIPQGKQLKRTPTGPVSSKEFDKDCILVDYSVHESSNSVLEVTKIESKLDYSLQIFVKTKKDKKTKCDQRDNIINDKDVSLENVDMKDTIIPKQIFKTEPNTTFDKNMDEIPANNDTSEKGDSIGSEIESTDSEEKNCEERDNMQVEETESQYIKTCDVIVKSSNSRNEQGRSVDEVAEKDIDVECGSLSKPAGASMELSDEELSVLCTAKSSGNVASNIGTESVFDRLISDQDDSGKEAEEIDSLFDDSFDIFPTRKQKKDDLKIYGKDGPSCSKSVKDVDAERVGKHVGKDFKTNVGSNIEGTTEDDEEEKNGDNANSKGVENLDALDEKDDNLKVPKKQTRQLRNRSRDSKLSKLNKGQQQNLDKKEIVKNCVTECKEEPKRSNRRLRINNTSNCQKVEVKRPNSRNKLSAVDVTDTEKEVGSTEKVEIKPHSEESEKIANVEVAPVRKGKTKTGKKMTSSSVSKSAEQSNESGKVNEKTKEGSSITNASEQLQKRAVRSRVKSKENLVDAKDNVVVMKTRRKAGVAEKNENEMDKHITKKNNQSSPSHKQVPLADITSSNIAKDRKNIKSKPSRTVGAKKGKQCSEEDKENSCSFIEPSVNEVSVAPKSKKVSVSKRITSQNTSVSHANKGKRVKKIENSENKEENIVNKKVVETNRKRSCNLKDSEDGASGAKKKRGSKADVCKSSTSSEQSLEKMEQPIANTKLLSSKDNSASEEQIRVICGTGKTQRKNEVGDEKKASATCRLPKQKKVSKDKEKSYTDDPESLLSCDISKIFVASRSRRCKRTLEDTVSLSKCGPSVTKKKNIPGELLQLEGQENGVKSKREPSLRAPRITKQSVSKTVVSNTSLMEKSVHQKVKGKQLLDKTCDDHASENVRTSRRCKTLAVAAIKESLNSSDSFERYRKRKH